MENISLSIYINQLNFLDLMLSSALSQIESPVRESTQEYYLTDFVYTYSAYLNLAESSWPASLCPFDFFCHMSYLLNEFLNDESRDFQLLVGLIASFSVLVAKELHQVQNKKEFLNV